MRRDLRVLLLAGLACALLGAILLVAAALNGVYQADHAPGAGCTVIYPDGSTAPGHVSAAGTCQP